MQLFLFNFFWGLSGAWIVSKYGAKIGMVDVPNGRSSHATKICKGGGFGVLFSFLFSALVLDVPHFFWLPALVMSLTSYWGGDKHKLSVVQRLIIHFGCSLYFLSALFVTTDAGAVAYLFCIPVAIYIVGTSNFYNFMDGIDGIAGITGCIGFFLLAYYGTLIGSDQVYGFLCVAMAFSCIGFLCLNFPRARVFLGDVGSILIGFLFACSTIVMATSFLDFVVMAGFLFPFYLDEISTMAVRIRNGDSLIIAHRKHIYQLLANEFGIPHWQVSVAYGFIQIAIGLSSVTVKPLGIFAVFLVYLIYSILFIGISKLIRKRASVR